ncbi:MAG: 2-hydroxyacid dehydrogenase [bacterium]
MPEVLLLKVDLERRSAQWRDAFAGFDLDVRDWDSPGDPAQIDYALVWQPEPGVLARFANLKLIFSIGAGLDHLRGDDVLPPGVAVIRMVEDELTAGMTEYVLYQTLRFHRCMPQYDDDQRARIWRERTQVPARERRVGLLGLGVLGEASARALAQLDFDVAGWSRGEKHIDRVASYHGADQLAAFLARSDILVCLLPLTAQTEGILNADNLARLPRGAFVINAARGGHCDESALLDALDRGHLAGAALDVFAREPLPPDDALWRHPRVCITPHIASMTLPASAARHVVDNIRRLRAGRALTHVVDFARGY